MTADDVKSPRDAVLAVRELIEEREEMQLEMKDLARRLHLVENDQGYLAKRDPPRVPKFPKILRELGIVPPEERSA